jgi:hypothetical protein
MSSSQCHVVENFAEFLISFRTSQLSEDNSRVSEEESKAYSNCVKGVPR